MISRMLDLVQRKVSDAGGKVVKSLGDGLVCQFGQVDAAFRAACEMQGAAAVTRGHFSPHEGSAAGC